MHGYHYRPLFATRAKHLGVYFNLEKFTFTSRKYDVENAVLGFSHEYVLIHTFTTITDKPLTKWTDTREISVEISTFQICVTS